MANGAYQYVQSPEGVIKKVDLTQANAQQLIEGLFRQGWTSPGAAAISGMSSSTIATIGATPGSIPGTAPAFQPVYKAPVNPVPVTPAAQPPITASPLVTQAQNTTVQPTTQQSSSQNPLNGMLQTMSPQYQLIFLYLVLLLMLNNYNQKPVTQPMQPNATSQPSYNYIYPSAGMSGGSSPVTLPNMGMYGPPKPPVSSLPSYNISAQAMASGRAGKQPGYASLGAWLGGTAPYIW